jgi:hypothetical protein
MRITKKFVGITAGRAKEYRGKACQFVVCALAKFIYDSAGYCRCSWELTWLASGMAPGVSKPDIFFTI